jgi:E3 ubiquitin-protein ligase DOA10
MDVEEVTENVEELECRVCRSGAELDHPLYSPCSCTGSIGLVHQDCLEAWLKHAGKTKCELCGVIYDFAPQYHPDTPSQLPLGVILETTIRLFVTNVFPYVLKLIAAVFIWLFMVPLLTAQIYRVWIRSRADDTLLGGANQLFQLGDTLEKSKSDVIGGLLICALIIFTCIVAVSSILNSLCLNCNDICVFSFHLPTLFDSWWLLKLSVLSKLATK